MPVLGGLTLLRYLSSPGENPKRPNCLLPPARPLVHEGSSWEGTSGFFCASPGGTGQCLHALDRSLPVPQGCCFLFVHAAHVLVNQRTPLLHRKQTNNNNETTTKKQQIKRFPPMFELLSNMHLYLYLFCKSSIRDQVLLVFPDVSPRCLLLVQICP